MVELRRVMISGRDGQLSRPSGSVAPNIICMVTVVRCAANLGPRARHTATLRGGGKWLLQSGQGDASVSVSRFYMSACLRNYLFVNST